MRVALFAGHTGKVARVRDVSWQILIESLGACPRHVCDPPGRHCALKNAAAWSPVDMEDGAHRKAENVRAITALVLDLDHITEEQLGTLADRLEATGWRYILHSTHSNAPPADYCLRLVLDLDRPITPAELAPARAAAEAALGIVADESTTDPCRLYYSPTAPEDGAPFLFAHGGSLACPVESVSAPAPAAPTTPAPGPAQLPPAGAEADGDADLDGGPVADSPGVPVVGRSEDPAAGGGAVDLSEIRSRLRRVRKQESRALIQSVLKGEPLAAPGGRDKTLNRVCSIIAGTCPELSPEAAVDILRPSIAAMPVEPEGLAHWLEEARDCFERALDRAAEYRKRQEEQNKALFGVASIPEPAKSQPLGDIVPAQEDEADGWRRDLLVTQNPQTGAIKLDKVPANAELILRCSAEWAGHIRYNEVTKEVELTGGPIQPIPADATLDVEVMNWLARSQWGLTLRQSEVGAQILAVARRNSYDPLRDYLLGLKWDGVPRLTTMLETYFRARLTNVDGEDITEYVRLVSRRWALSAVARALEPGCKVDTVLVLEGVQQGEGKTSAFLLLGEPWSTDSAVSVDDKDAAMMAATTWIIELGELDTLRRADSSAAKAFLSRRVERYRPPYGKVLEDQPRRCVFVGSTNKTEYLTDPTGNRRYWPVRVGDVDRRALVADRDQLWAEAVHLYLAANKCERCAPLMPLERCWEHRWWFDRAESKLVAEQTEERMAPDGAPVERVLSWWLRKLPTRRPAYVTVRQIATEALGVADQHINRALEIAIGEALRQLGFTRQRRRVAGLPVWAYVPPAALRDAPQQVDDGPGTAMIASAQVPRLN